MILKYCIKNRYNYKIYSSGFNHHCELLKFSKSNDTSLGKMYDNEKYFPYYFKQSYDEISYLDNTTDSRERIRDHILIYYLKIKLYLTSLLKYYLIFL